MTLSIELLILLLLILFNGVLAMAEMAIVSARKVRLQQRADDGDERAHAALRLAENPSDFLSTVQVGITLVGVLSGAIGGATIAEELSSWFARFLVLQPYSEALAVGVVVTVITYFSLVLGELVPKRLALTNPEDMAARVAWSMQRLARLARPLVHLLSASSSLALRLLGVRPSAEPPITEEEIKVLIDQGTQAGVFAEEEQEMLEAVLRLGDRRVDMLMTPRTELIWLNVEDSLADNLEVLRTSHHSRFPLAQGNLDNILGIVHARDVLALRLSDQPIDLVQVMKEALFVPESTQAHKVLELFRETHQQAAMVLDEYGGLSGMVTVFDLLEAIVGDFPVLGGLGVGSLTLRADGSYLIDGRLTIDMFKDALDIDELPGEARGSYQTVGGFIMTALASIPKPADRLEWAGWQFEVMDMDGMRVDKVLATKSKK